MNGDPRVDLLRLIAERVGWIRTGGVDGAFEAWGSRDGLDEVLLPMNADAGDYERLLEKAEKRLRLERWKAEALGIIDYLGEQQRRAEDERESALAEVERLTAERDALAAQVARVETHHRILTEAHKHVVASRDSRRGLSDHADLCAYATALERCRDQLRAALAGPTGQEADRG